MLGEKTRAALIAQFPAVMDFQDVRSLLRVSQRTIYRLIEDRQIPCWKDEEGEWSFLREDVLDYLSRNCNV